MKRKKKHKNVLKIIIRYILKNIVPSIIIIIAAIVPLIITKKMYFIDGRFEVALFFITNVPLFLISGYIAININMLYYKILKKNNIIK